MRALVFLLVLANLMFFAWQQGYFGTSPSPDANRLAGQISPERLRVVARGEAPASATVATATAKPLPPPAESCLAWSGLIAAEADRLARLVGERVPAARLTRKAEATTAKAWWVFIPPQTNRVEAERKAAELRRLEVAEFYIVQDAGPTRLALSLGVFSTEAAAAAYLETLRGKGVKSARVGPKGGVEPHLAVEVRGPESELVGLRDVLAERPAAECPAPVVASAKS